MAYDNIISRTDAQALIPEEVVDGIITKATEESAALTLFRRVPMARAQARIPVLSALPTAYFVTGDTGHKQTTEVNWDDKFLNVEEIACIVPIPENVLDDTAFDVWAAIRPLIEEAVARRLDGAIFFGINKPASWPDDVITQARAAGNSVVRGTNAAAAGGIAADLSDVMATLEADGFDPNGMIAKRAIRGRLRQARDSTGQRLLDVSMDMFEGMRIAWPMRGLWPAGLSATEAIIGDFSQGVIGVRRDITYKVLDQAVITDPGAGNAIIYNLPQQDMVALRVVFRVAWQVPNPINYDNATEATRWPFAELRGPAA